MIKQGETFGRWTVIGDYIKDSKNGHKKYLCECGCEKKTQRYVDEQSLKRGRSVSCGCLTIEVAKKHFTKHGQRRTRLYSIWTGIKGRCNNPNNQRYADYGGRGIAVCEEWENNFEAFREWAYKNGFKDNANSTECTIDRKDNDKGYSPDNCRWITLKEQCYNRRSNTYIEYKGERHTITEWAEITGIKRATLQRRHSKGFSLEDIFFRGDLRKRGLI